MGPAGTLLGLAAVAGRTAAGAVRGPRLAAAAALSAAGLLGPAALSLDRPFSDRGDTAVHAAGWGTGVACGVALAIVRARLGR